MHYDDGDNNWQEHSHGGGREHLNVPKNAEEAREQYERLKANNLNTLKNIDFETDEKGQTTYLGVPISKDMKPLLELAVDTVKPMLIGQSEKVSTGISKLAHRLGFTKSHAAVGVVAENVFRWGLVGVVQILDTVRASSKYSRERKDLFTTLSPVIHSTGANLHNNEVIKVAYDDIHSNWVSEMKKVVADIPSLIPAGMVAWEEQLASVKRRKNKKPEHHEDHGAAGIISGNHEREKRWLEEDRAMDAALARDRARVDSMAQGPARDIAERSLLSSERRVEEYRERRWNDDGAHAPHDAGKEKANSGSYNSYMYALAPFASLFSQKIKSNINEEIQTRKKRVRAWKMIEHLKAELDNQCADKRVSDRNGYENCERDFRSKSPEEIYISGIGSREGEQINLREFVVELFQQHERDRDHNRSFYDKKTGKAIDPLKGAMLNNLMPSVDIIAESLANGTISGDALYKLVGENKVIKHSPSGARVFVKEDELRKYIDKELAPVLGTREGMKPEEFMAKFANPALIEETLKKNLAAMHGLEKALFASLFPDDILEHAGVKKKEITELRKRAHEHAYDFVASAVMYLSKKTPEELKALGVSEKEAGSINSLADRVNEGDMKALKLAVDGRDKEVLDAVRTAGLLEQVKDGGKEAEGEGRKFWAERVKEMSATRQQLKKNHDKARTEGRDGDQHMRDSKDRYDDKDRGYASRERESRRDRDSYRSDDYDSGRDSKSGRDYDRGRDDDWGSKDKGSNDYAGRFDSGRGGYAARERLSKNKEISREDDVRGIV